MKNNRVTREQGMVLIVALIMLLLLTVIGLSAISGSDLQERMAGNTRDRNLAFQSAEAALRKGEDVPFIVFDGTNPGYWPDLNTYTGAIGRPITWTADEWKNANRTLALAPSTISGVAEQPRYVVEQLLIPATPSDEGSAVDVQSKEQMADKEYFRITSRGVGATSDAEVILQSTYIR